MNILSAILHALAHAFEHIIGDPVHTKAATAIKSALVATSALVESFNPAGAQQAAEDLLAKLEELRDKGRAVLATEWDELIALAQHHHTLALAAPPQQQQQEPKPAPEHPTAAS